MRKRTGVALVAAGLVAGLVLGSIGIATAATASKATTGRAGWAGGPGGGRGGRGMGMGMMGGGGLANTVAELTGIDENDVRTQRAAGTSYEAIAKPKGVTADEIVAEAIKDAKTMMDAAVKVGRMTAAQEKQILADLKTRLEAEVSSTEELPFGGRGMGGGMGGRMMGGGVRGGGLASSVASLTGMSVDDVIEQRQSGKSFAEIAKAKGVASDSVIEKALAAATSALKTRFEAEIDETSTVGPGGRGPGGGPGGGRGGFGGGPGGF